MFRFKQFSVDQTGCAMKVNTDGVLLGAMAGTDKPLSVLDIGTGTGVIALMLAQRFTDAEIDAVEIDESAAETAKNNFANSPFAERLTVYPTGFEVFFENHPEKKYDLIVSNPPFYINSLQSPGEKKNLAKHTDVDFFERLVEAMANHLSENGLCWLILPTETAEIVKSQVEKYRLYLQKIINVQSFENDNAHREIIAFGFKDVSPETDILAIYEAVTSYSVQYKQLLKQYFLAF